MTAITVESEGLTETLKAFSGLEADLRKRANGELRDAARECAGKLALELRAAAASSPTPQAALVATTIKVKSDRIPVVSIGGNRRVGRNRTPAAQIQWGSERGGHNFVAAAGGAYWIAPTVERFGSSTAVTTYKRAVYEIMHKWGLV